MNGLPQLPQSVPLCSAVAAMVSINDLADRAPRAIADGEPHLARDALRALAWMHRTCHTRGNAAS